MSSNAVIQGNTVNGKTENVRLTSDAGIAINGALGDNASVGVTMASQTVVFSTGLPQRGAATNLFSDNENTTVAILNCRSINKKKSLDNVPVACYNINNLIG